MAPQLHHHEFLQWSVAAVAAMHAPQLFGEGAPHAPVSAKVQIRHIGLHARDLAAQKEEIGNRGTTDER